MTWHRLANAPALAVALAASSLVAAAVLGFAAGPAQAAPEWHARAIASASTPVSASVEPGSVVAMPAAASAAAPSAAKTTKPFPVGFIIGGVLVVIGFAGGVYGQMLRRRGRRPPGV
ncbi:MAG: hypothetical protein JWM49_142 [Microbacteriaceae bacterium]|jgi:zinc transporter ZupT|nr:hypothetical protein [Microbacteriaceae bacterium]